MNIQPKPGELWITVCPVFAWPENDLTARYIREDVVCLALGPSKTEKTTTGVEMCLFLVNERILVIPPQYFFDGHLVKHEYKK